MVKSWTIFLFLCATLNIVLSRNTGEVVSIDSKNFHSLVESSDKLWVIKYYIPWCGFCVRFAPTFTALAKTTKDWDFIRFGEISCPQDSALCASHEAVKTPDVKLLIPSPGHLGIKPLMTGVTTERMLYVLVGNFLNELNSIQQSDTLESKKLPVLKRLSDFTDVQFNQGTGVSNIFFIVESSEDDYSRTAELVILDMFKHRDQLRVYRTSLENAVNNLNVYRRGLYRFSENAVFVEILTNSTRSDMGRAILSNVGINANSSDHHKSESNHSVVDATYVYSEAHGLHLADLITGLRYSLFIEVPMLTEMNEDARLALKKYLDILIRYHPADLEIINFLQLVRDWLEKQPAPITSKEWLRTLASMESPEAFISANTTWKGCKGSDVHLRGYPCSLWMTFHTITVRAYLDKQIRFNNSADDDRIGMDILMAIRGYVEHFFSCSECSHNFVHNSRNWLNLSSEHWPPKRAVLDLWRRHNMVNTRLHSQPITEDPKNPKIQFPAVEDCRRCRRFPEKQKKVFVSSLIDWDLEQVFQFLVRYYGVQPKAASCAEKGKTLFSSKWTSCSKTCDTGVSMRLSNNNDDCSLHMETRLCLDRPCSLRFPDWSRSHWHRARCPQAGHTYQMMHPVEFRFHNCTTTVNRKRKICGLCPKSISTRRPVCCKPSISRTEHVDFKCANAVDADEPEFDGDGVWLNKKNGNDIVHGRTKIAIEMIELCHCSEKYCEAN